MRVTLLDAVREKYRVSIERPGTTMAKYHSCRASMRLLFPVAMILSCLTLAACAHAQPQNASPAPKRRTMTADATPPQSGEASVHPKLTAEQALLRLLELIRTSKTIADFTPERLEQVMGVPITPREDGYGFYEQLTTEWSEVF